ncbi:MAG: class I tRNA ligase family protein [Chthoniobacterales bacterium]
MKPYFITTAIDYTNGAPHTGHAYEKVLADALARFQRQSGRDVFFLTGVDQHGQKVQQSAEKLGIQPAEFVENLTAQFRSLWSDLAISNNAWAATTDPLHVRCVQGILQQLFDAGQIYRSTQTGHYSVRQEQFVTDKERGPDGEFGPEWGEVTLIEEENYYFRLEKHRDWLLDYVDTHPNFITPEFRRTELRNAVEKLTGDLCISRPKSRLQWGIELPFDPDFVTYVWFDALINYISFAGYEPSSPLNTQLSTLNFTWPALHVIGKDILIPAHGVYWPIMLHAIGFPDDAIPPLLVHGWWNISGAKMSKSLGNVVAPTELIERYGADAVRYYLLADIVTGRDADFNPTRLEERYNSDLANGIGNLLNRTLNMAKKYREGVLRSDTTDGLRPAAESAVAAYTAAFERSDPRAAIDAIVDLANAANQHVDQSAPWKLAKSESDAAALDTVLYHLAETTRILAILLNPIVPTAAEKIATQLAIDPATLTMANATWGGLPDGHTLSAPSPVFPRIDTTKSSVES